jgi:VWFA-related protein
MRKLALLFFLALTVLPAVAAKRVTVDQLEQALAAAHRKPDAEVAQQLASLELTERLSADSLAKLQTELPGEKSRQAFMMLADAAAFLDLPAAKIPSTAAPDVTAQRNILALTVNYVAQTVQKLPNFFANRVTTSFEDSPVAQRPGAISAQGMTSATAYQPLHLVGSSTATVFYRDGHEVVDTVDVKDRQQPAERRLNASGVFGPILATVLVDAARSKLAWSHWEQGPVGLEAVFSYAAPKEKSHYTLTYESIPTDPLAAPCSAKPESYSQIVAYHGEMAIDPSTGTILRLMLAADLKPGEFMIRSGIVVEYGQVEIGGKTYFGPVKSVTSTLAHSLVTVEGNCPGLEMNTAVKTSLNDVLFDQYHIFRAETRILTDASDESPGNPSGSVPGGAASANSQPVPPAPAGSPVMAETTPPPAPATEATSAQPQPPPAELEISVEAARSLPDAPAGAPAPAEGAFVLKMTSRLVDVGVVVVDKKGNPVKDLKPEDFEVYDNGRKQEIKFFSEFAGALAGESAAATGSSSAANVEPIRTFSNRAEDAAATGTGAIKPAQATEAGATILLVDESHIAWGDLSNARQQVIKFLNTLAPGERVGLYTMTGLGFRVLTEATNDHAAVIARLSKWMPSAQSLSQARGEETHNRQQFETVNNTADLNSVNGNQTEVPDSNTPVDPQLLRLGGDPGHASLVILRGVARHLSAIPGHKSLVWVSSDNVLVNWNDKAVGTNKAVDEIDADALHAQEAMNDAHVAVYPFDVSQLEAGGVSADIGRRNVELAPTAKERSIPGGTSRDMTDGRDKAEMLQDLRPIQGPIRQVAQATGGRIIRRSGDLAGALAGIVQDGHATYQLSFYPDTPSDDKYHTIAVKLADKKGLTLRYRTGYLYAKEPATLKERFQRAIWRPIDADEIRVTATIDKTGRVKIDVATSDLGLQQQAGRWMDKLDFFFIQRDDAGQHAEVEGQTLGLRLTPATYQRLAASGVPFERDVKLKPGVASLRVLVVDENSGRMGSVTIPAPAFGGAL